jgi:hypothetical protein
VDQDETVLFYAEKDFFQKGTTATFDLVKGSYHRLFLLVFTPLSGTAISIDGIRVENIDTRI